MLGPTERIVKFDDLSMKVQFLRIEQDLFKKILSFVSVIQA